jgi:hypothetical protein
MTIRPASLIALFALATPLSAQTTDSSAVAIPNAAAPAAATARYVAPNHPVVRECDAMQPAWIFCDDFEHNRLKDYFEYNAADSSFELTDSIGVLGSTGMRVHFRKGEVDAGSLRLAFGKTPSPYIHPVDSGATIYRELYWRVYVRNDSTWIGGGGDKLSRAQVLASPTWAQAMGAPIWSGGGGKKPGSPTSNYLVIDPYSGTDLSGKLVTTTYNDFPRLRWLGARRGRTPLFDRTHVGNWYCVEGHVRLNDAGQSNGVFEMWIDDWLEARDANLNWVGNFSEYGLNTVFLENYWNAGSPVDQTRYMDNFVVSTQRIGCGRLIPPVVPPDIPPAVVPDSAVPDTVSHVALPTSDTTHVTR